MPQSQCPNLKVAMPQPRSRNAPLLDGMPHFLGSRLYIYFYIILKIIVRLLNAFHLHLFLAARYIYVYIYNIFYIILTSFCYIIECAPVVLVSCGNIYIYIYIYVCIYKTFYIILISLLFHY